MELSFVVEKGTYGMVDHMVYGWMDRSGSIYIIITGSQSGPAGYETFADPHKIAFHI